MEKKDNKVKIIFLANIEYLRKHRLICKTAYFKTIVLFIKKEVCALDLILRIMLG